MDDERLTRKYDMEFFESGGYADYLADEIVLRKNFQRFIACIRPFSPAGRMLEIGCAYGFFLDCAKHYWDAEGVDISAKATAHAREKLGVRALEGDFLKLPFEEGSYDAVVLWDTIEHLRHPAEYIAKAARLLKPGGMLALTTGDVASLVAKVQGPRWRLYYPPYHLHYFSERTLARLLSRFDLKPAHFRKVGYDRSLDMILHRLLNERKPPLLQSLYRAACRVGLANRRSIYLNLYDIMLMVARKSS